MLRIGILTYFASINYGAFLQAYALQECLKSRYSDLADIELIDYEAKTAHEIYLRRTLNMDHLLRNKLVRQYDKFLKDREKLKLSKEFLITDSIKQVEKFLQGKYDIIIAGSDEIWRTDSFRGFPTAYWLNFNLGKTIYMAYAVSGRNDYQKLTKGMQKYMKDSVEHFYYIGTRDEVTKRELRQIVNQEIDRNCDPIFLIPELFRIKDKEKVRKRLTEKFGIAIDRPLISLMLSYSEDNCEIAGHLFNMMRHDSLVLNLYEPYKGVSEYNLIELSPFEWSDVIGISDLVITDFFHGTVFSLLHGVPFLSVEHSKKGRGKIENLLKENFMEDKILYQIDYNGNNKKLAVDLYTKARKEMRHYRNSHAEKVMLREYEKSRNFFDVLERSIENGI